MEKIKKNEEILENEKIPKNYIPINTTIQRLHDKYYDKRISSCPELDNYEVRKLFGKYDKANIGAIQKNHLKFLFNDIKNLLAKTLHINEKKFIDNFINFYFKSKESVSIEDVKKCFGVILHEHRSNIVCRFNLF